MTQLQAQLDQPHVGILRAVIVPGLLLWPVLACDAAALSTPHKLLGLVLLACLLRHLERRTGAGWALMAAALVLLRAVAPTPQVTSLLDLLAPYAAALSLSLALLGGRKA